MFIELCSLLSGETGFEVVNYFVRLSEEVSFGFRLRFYNIIVGPGSS